MLPSPSGAKGAHPRYFKVCKHLRVSSALTVAPSYPQVVVVGAGIAGLSAAHHLVASKGVKSVIVIEGRERVGGKVHTKTVRQRPLELGAEWIRGTCPANSVFNLANR